jgi:cysteine synthase
MCQRLKEGKTLAFVCGVVQILGKCEFLNPGGSVKDRVALKIIEEVNYYYF